MTSIVVYHGCSLTFAWLSNVPLIHKQVLQQTFGDIMGSMYETSIGPYVFSGSLGLSHNGHAVEPDVGHIQV